MHQYDLTAWMLDIQPGSESRLRKKKASTGILRLAGSHSVLVFAFHLVVHYACLILATARFGSCSRMLGPCRSTSKNSCVTAPRRSLALTLRLLLLRGAFGSSCNVTGFHALFPNLRLGLGLGADLPSLGTASPPYLNAHCSED